MCFVCLCLQACNSASSDLTFFLLFVLFHLVFSLCLALCSRIYEQRLIAVAGPKHTSQYATFIQNDLKKSLSQNEHKDENLSWNDLKSNLTKYMAEERTRQRRVSQMNKAKELWKTTSVVVRAALRKVPQVVVEDGAEEERSGERERSTRIMNASSEKHDPRAHNSSLTSTSKRRYSLGLMRFTASVLDRAHGEIFFFNSPKLFYFARNIR